MREIKFRFYSKVNKVMHKWGEFPRGTTLLALNDNEENEKHSCWMQYTGLKDKNGKEIYEGDIVKGIRDSHWHGGKDRVLGKVHFDSNNLSFIVDGMGGGALHNIEDLEIISNIYENPELIQE